MAGPSALPPGTELVQYRTENSRTFVAEDGHYVTNLYLVPGEQGSGEPPQAELDSIYPCYPQSANLWTGYVWHQQSNYQKLSGDMAYRGAGPASHADYQAWCKIDLSPIPDSAVVNGVFFYHYCYSVSVVPPTTVIRLVAGDPVTLDAQTLYNQIMGGWPLTGSYSSGIGWHGRDLGGTGAIAVEDRLDDDWIALGINATIEDSTYWGVSYGYLGGPGGAYVPYLSIDWMPPPQVDIAVQDIIVPTGTVRWDSIVNPEAVWMNVNTATSTFMAYFALLDPMGTRVYFESTSVTLAPGEDTSHVFPNYFLNYNNGLWTARCSTKALGDINFNNDVMWEYFWVTEGGFNPDMAAVEVISPVGYYDTSATVTPEGKFHNNSPFPASFTGFFSINDPNGVPRYMNAIAVAGLGPGLDTTVAFADFTVDTTRGVWVTRCSTWAVGDTVNGNDVVASGFGVYPGGIPPDPPDMAVTGILAPVGYVDTCVTVTPRAVWHNNSGTHTAVFSAWFSIIDPNDIEVYNDAVAVSALGPGMDTAIVFDDFSLDTTRGTWQVRCSTFCATDTVPANDVLVGAFGVYPGGAPPWDPGWKEVKPMPAPPSNNVVKHGGWLTYNRFDDFIYGAKGNKTSDFYRYSAQGDTWTELAGMPYAKHPVWFKKQPRKGGRGVSDGAAYIYATQGNNSLGFWRYHVPGDSWEMLKDVPLGAYRKKVKGGTDVVYIERNDTGYVYLLKGYKTEFYRYNTLSGEWEDCAAAPTGQRAKWDKGSWLCCEDENADFIYAHKAKYHEMYMYNVDGDSWGDNIGGMPFIGRMARRKKSKDGGSAAWHDGAIYALKGGNTQEYWKYTIAADSWTELESIPAFGSTGKKKRIKYGADLVYYGEEAFFALKGNKTLEFWRYVLAPWPATPDNRGVSVMSGVTRGASGVLSVSPNPLSTGFARVHYERFLGGAAELVVYDASGRAALRRSLTLGRNGTVDLDLRALSAGTYFVRLSDRGGNSTSKLVINQ